MGVGANFYTSGERAVASLSPQPRRTGSWTPHRGTARESVQGLRPSKEHAALRPWYSAQTDPDAAQQSANARTGLQPALFAARYADDAVWRRDRNRRQSAAARTRMRPYANAMDRRHARRVLAREE